MNHYIILYKETITWVSNTTAKQIVCAQQHRSILAATIYLISSLTGPHRPKHY